MVKFHIRPLQDRKALSNDIRDKARIEKAWGRKKALRKDEFKYARNGDHLMIPFECDLCIFHKLRTCEPNPKSDKDILLMATIRRMNLDAFWSRMPDTIKANRSRLLKGMSFLERVGLHGPCLHQGPFPNYDHCGYELAVQMLLYSLNPGRNAKDHLQFDTIRQLSSAYGNQVRASPQSSSVTMAMADDRGRYQRFSTDASGSLWFKRFYQGCKYRMGQEWRSNQAFSVQLLLKLLHKTEVMITSSPDKYELNRWIVFHAFAVVTYVLSLRGPEGVLLDLEGLHNFWDDEKGSLLVITLLGRVKGERDERWHTLPCVDCTSSGIEVRASVARLMNLKLSQGFERGPAISDVYGDVFPSKILDEMLLELLEEIFKEDKRIFPENIKSDDDIRNAYHCYRSFRRASDTRALEKKLGKDDINIVNRWSTVEKVEGRRPSQDMRFYYADLALLKGPFLRYTYGM